MWLGVSSSIDVVHDLVGDRIDDRCFSFCLMIDQDVVAVTAFYDMSQLVIRTQGNTFEYPMRMEIEDQQHIRLEGKSIYQILEDGSGSSPHLYVGTHIEFSAITATTHVVRPVPRQQDTVYPRP